MSLLEMKEIIMNRMNENIENGREYHERYVEAKADKSTSDKTLTSYLVLFKEYYHCACEDIRVMRELKFITYKEADELFDKAFDRVYGQDVEFYAM